MQFSKQVDGENVGLEIGPSKIAASISCRLILFDFFMSSTPSLWMVWETSWHSVPANCSVFFPK